MSSNANSYQETKQFQPEAILTKGISDEAGGLHASEVSQDRRASNTLCRSSCSRRCLAGTRSGRRPAGSFMSGFPARHPKRRRKYTQSGDISR